MFARGAGAGVFRLLGPRLEHPEPLPAPNTSHRMNEARLQRLLRCRGAPGWVAPSVLVHIRVIGHLQTKNGLDVFMTLCLWFHCFRLLVECELFHRQNWVMWIPCPRNQHAYSYGRNPSFLPDYASGSCARGSQEIVMYRTCYGAFCTFRRRILRGGSTAWRILRSGT